MDKYKTLGGLVQCNQCTAHARRSGWQRCLLPAVNGKTVCRVHGGSRGKTSEEGKKRIAKANTIHGFETRQIRKERSEGLARLATLEELGRKIGLITGEKTRGPKPKGFKGVD